MEEKLWVTQYIHELDREKRKEILDATIEAEGLSPENELRRKLYEARYASSSNGDVDYFIRGWLGMFYLHGSGKGLFAKKKLEREINSVKSDWKVALAEEYGETGRTVLYQELVNMTCLYISLCQKDKAYGSVLLGIGRMKPESLAAKIATDVYRIAYQTPKDLKREEEFALFTQAATEGFSIMFPKEEGLLTDKINGGK